MKRFIILLLAVFSCLAVSAQNLTQKYNGLMNRWEYYER